jgi:hypothetical protein
MSAARRAACVAALAAALCAGTGAGTAAAAPVLPRAMTFGPGVFPELAQNGDGTAVAAWFAREDGTVRAAVRPAGARRWGRVAAVSARGVSVASQRIAVDDVGNAMVVWTSGAAQSAIMGSYRPGGRSWNAPEAISPSGLIARISDVAMGGTGAVLAAWTDHDGFPVAASRAAPGVWEVQGLGPSRVDILRTAFTRQGTAIVFWRAIGPSFASWAIVAALRPAGAAFGAPGFVSGVASGYPDGLSLPRIAVGADGTAAAVWVRVTGGWRRAEAALLAPGATAFGPPELVSPSGHNVAAPDVALDARGNVVAVWQRADGRGGTAIEAATRPAGGDWGPPQRLSPPGPRVFTPRVAAGGPGAAIVVWTRARRGGLAVEGARRPRGRVLFDRAFRIFDPPERRAIGRFARVAMDARDRAVVIWERSHALASPVIQALDLGR